ncbi:MAG TPA: right-handed parallel beta-helix repeat-containing protein [Puia sp.]|nr:right-handed parallel beta-helix repeat-containing protein [Puia sp.]
MIVQKYSKAGLAATVMRLTIMYIPRLNFLFFLLLNLQVCYSQKTSPLSKREGLVARKLYFSTSGSDNNDGTINHPFNSISKFNNLDFVAGDKIYFKGGETFNGSMFIDSTKSGTSKKNIEISSYGNGKAIINSGNLTAFLLYKTKFIQVNNLKFIGVGRKNGNTKDGVRIDNSDNISIKNIDVSGFQKSGLFIYSSSNIKATNVYAHENGAAGIAVDGAYSIKESNYNIYIDNCTAENNPGDPTNLNNHSGNGIVVGNCKKVMIEYCTATNNGWDMPRIGNGPVGIWAYEADSVIIQHCLSYRNKTSVGGADGGGFDFDGGVTNSIIQYCLSYENQGAGYSIFQYLYATPWYNNIFRFNISENDGSVSDSKAGVYIWNSSRDSNQFYNCFFYNNTIYNSKGFALTYSELSEHKNFSFYNNIFIGEDSLIRGIKGVDVFVGNDWWCLKNKLPGKIVGLNINLVFKNPGNAKITSAKQLNQFFNYQLPQSSLLKNKGINLYKQYKINNGGIDFLSKPIITNGIGACLN